MRPPPSGSGERSRASVVLSARRALTSSIAGGWLSKNWDRRPAIGRLSGRIGNARYVIEPKSLRRAQLPFDHHAMVPGRSGRRAGPIWSPANIIVIGIFGKWSAGRPSIIANTRS